MGASATVSDLNGLMRTLFPNRDIFQGYDESMALREINKDTKFFGRNKETTVDYAPTSGGSAAFDEAQANQGASTRVTFVITHKKEYQLFSVDGQLLATARDKGAIRDAYGVEMKHAGYGFGRSMAAGLWGNGGGSLGQIASGHTTATITLTQRADIVKFEPGMWLHASVDDGSTPTTIRTGGAKKIQVLSRNTQNGTVTFSAALNTVITDVGASDYLFRAGDYGVKFSGFLGWHPIATPGAALFNNVNRSVSPERLSGYRYAAGAAGAKLDIIENAVAEARLQGIHGLTRLYCNPLDYREISKELQTKEYIDIKTDNPKFGFRTLAHMSQMGELGIVSETNVPKGYAWMLDPKNYYLRSAGECPQVLDGDGQSRTRHATADAYEHRMGAYLNLDCENPGKALIITW